MLNKSIFLLTLVAFFYASGYSQRIVEKSIQLSSGQEISLDFEFADDIIIKPWEKNEIYVKASVNINDNENNDLFELDVKESSAGVLLTSKIKNLKNLWNNRSVIIGEEEAYRFDGGCISIIISFEVYLPGDFPLEIETISGDIEIDTYTGSLDIETVSGFIDLGLPEDLKANICLETVTGEMFSNLNFDPKSKYGDLDQIGGGDIKTTINGGGIRIDLETVSGDIYLRKK